MKFKQRQLLFLPKIISQTIDVIRQRHVVGNIIPNVSKKRCTHVHFVNNSSINKYNSLRSTYYMHKLCMVYYIIVYKLLERSYSF